MKEIEATTMTQYLLGQLPDAERDVCEQEWFTDKVKYGELCEVENALIDDYVRGALHGAERALFEQHFLTLPARRERVLNAQALLQMIDQSASRAAPARQRWLAGWRVPQLIPALTLGLLLLLGGLWAIWRQRELQEQLARTAVTVAEQQRRAQELEQSLAAERAANARLTEELAGRNNASASQPTASPVKPKTLFLALTAGVLRSDGDALPTLQLAKDIKHVQLQVTLPAHEYRQFTARLRTAEGRDVQRWTVKTAGTRLSLTLAAQQLKPGDYVLVVNGINAERAVDEFRRVPFRVRSL